MSSSSTNSSRVSANGVSANEAIAHVIYGDYSKLFGTIVVGWLLLQSGTFLVGSGFETPTPDGWAILLGLALALAGAGSFFVGIVALGYKLLAEAHVRAAA
jgi:hypothetical protein